MKIERLKNGFIRAEAGELHQVADELGGCVAEVLTAMADRRIEVGEIEECGNRKHFRTYTMQPDRDREWVLSKIEQ